MSHDFTRISFCEVLPIHSTLALPRVSKNGGLTPPSEGVVLPLWTRSWCPGWTQHLPAKGDLGQPHLMLLLSCYWSTLSCSANWFHTHSYQAEVRLPDLVNLSHGRRELNWSIHSCSDLCLWKAGAVTASNPFLLTGKPAHWQALIWFLE